MAGYPNPKIGETVWIKTLEDFGRVLSNTTGNPATIFLRVDGKKTEVLRVDMHKSLLHAHNKPGRPHPKRVEAPVIVIDGYDCCPACTQPVDAAYASGQYETLAKQLEKDLRKEWALNHGCSISALYGDDGEMDCNACRTDFAHDPLETLRPRVVELRQRILKKLVPNGR